MTELAATLFASFPDIRYVATYLEGRLELNQRDGIVNASASESDKYEELIVNPTLVKLLQQRGDIDCGGMDYVVVRYGHFFELIQPVPQGHVSVGIQPDAAIDRVVTGVRATVADWFRAGFAVEPWLLVANE
jgi:hypothetical protein